MRQLFNYESGGVVLGAKKVSSSVNVIFIYPMSAKKIRIRNHYHIDINQIMFTGRKSRAKETG